MSTAAMAALLVAIGLLVLAAAACAVQMTPVKDARLRRLAHLYLDPLATWCLAAVVVHALTLVAAGDLVALKLVLPIGIGIAAFLLRWADEPDAAPAQPASTPDAASARGASPRTPFGMSPRAASARPGTPAPARATASPLPGAPASAHAAASPRGAAPAPSASAPPVSPAPVRPATGSLWSRHSA